MRMRRLARRRRSYLASGSLPIVGTAWAADADGEEVIEEAVVTAKYQRSLADGISRKRDADD